MIKTKKKKITEEMYDIIRKPVVTEKSTLMTELGKVSFEVSMDATKPQIKSAVEGLFGVDVMGVNTLIRKGKSKRFRGKAGRRPDRKLAIVTLKDGQMIDLSTGL